MPKYKNKETGDVIDVKNVRVIFSSGGKIEVDKDGVYNLSEYDAVPLDGGYESIFCKPNANDKRKW